MPDLASPAFRRMLGAVAVSLAFHALFLSELRGAPGGAGASGLSPGNLPATPLQVWLGRDGGLPAPSPDPSETVAPEEPTATASPARSPIQGAGRDQAGLQRAGVALLPASHYYSLAELDVRPWIKVHVEPQFPPITSGSEGHRAVVLRLYISEEGLIDRIVTVSNSSGLSFEEAAVRAFSVARFSPALKKGRPVKAQLLVEVNFDSAAAPPP